MTTDNLMKEVTEIIGGILLLLSVVFFLVGCVLGLLINPILFWVGMVPAAIIGWYLIINDD